MSNLLPRLRGFADKLLRTGFFSVFFSSAFSRVLTFIGGMIIVRVLSKDDYGSYTYVMNCYGMICLLNDLGCGNATMQFCSENYKDENKSGAFFRYGWKMAMLFSAITAVLTFFSPWFYPFKEQEAARMAQSLCLIPFLTTANSFLEVNLRVRLLNDRFAKFNIVSTAVHYLVILPGSWWFGVWGAVLSNYVIRGLTLLYGFYLSRKQLPAFRDGQKLCTDEKWELLKLAFASQVNNSAYGLLNLFDIFLIGIFIGENIIISSYKIATTIPSALAFIPAAVMTYIIPYFARHKGDLKWVKRNYAKLVLCCLGGSAAISVICILAGPWIIPLLFGRQYEDAVTCYIILMVGYFFHAGLQTPTLNVLYTQRKVWQCTAMVMISGLLNCILDVILILRIGSIGAAIATSFLHVCVALMSVGYILFYLNRSSNKQSVNEKEL